MHPSRETVHAFIPYSSPLMRSHAPSAQPHYVGHTPGLCSRTHPCSCGSRMSASHAPATAPRMHRTSTSMHPRSPRRVHRRGHWGVHRRAPPRASSPLLPPAPAPAPLLLPVCVPSHACAPWHRRARPAQREELRFLRRGSSRNLASISAYVCSESSVCRSSRCSRIWMRNMASWQ